MDPPITIEFFGPCNAWGVLAAYFSVKPLEDPAVNAEADAADSKKRWGFLGLDGDVVGFF